MLPFLTAVELFHGISAGEAHKIATLCAERTYPQGDSVFSEGGASDSLFIVKSGRVKLVSVSKKGTQRILHIVKPDDVFGELFLAQRERPFTAIAIEDVVVSVIPRESFVLLLSSVPTLALNFIRLLSKRLMKTERELAEFGHTWSYNRLAMVLVELCEEYGKETNAGTRIDLRLTHEDLANIIGTTRETVTVQLNKFERMGILHRRERHLVVNRPRLAAFMHL